MKATRQDLFLQQHSPPKISDDIQPAKKIRKKNKDTDVSDAKEAKEPKGRAKKG